MWDEFDIHFSIDEDEAISERAKVQKKNKLNQLLEKLLKYGNYEEMKEKLQILKENHLDFVFSMHEILTSREIRNRYYRINEKTTNDFIPTYDGEKE